ncbi:MAG: flagellar basal body-associated FliL family protein [Nitrosomonadales bacterium]|nr:flagellar basal body-associated FliL family protein [Nitrosomonadales bacterium]
MAKTEKPAPASHGKGADAGAAEGAAKPKSKKPLLIAAGVLVLAIAGGAGWYFTKGNSSHGDSAKKTPSAKLEQPKFIPLDAFTVNLQREEGDQFLQVGITLKIDDPTLEEKIKLAMPEIRSRLLLLLSGKRASELAPVDGKKKLAKEVIAEVNGALGLRKAPAKPKKAAAPKSEEHGADDAHQDAASAPAEEAAAEEEAPAEPAEEPVAADILDVLFTSFIIQ